MPELSPWDALTWFQLPTFQATAPNMVGAAPQCAPADPNRVVLIMGPASAGSVAIVSIDPQLSSTTGVYIGANAGPMILTQREHGSLCQAAWYVAGGSATVYAVMLALRAWPEDGTRDALEQVTLALTRVSEVLRGLLARQS